MVISKSDFESWMTSQLKDQRATAWIVVLLAAVIFVLYPCIEHWVYDLPFRFSRLGFLFPGLLAGYGVGKYWGTESALNSLLTHLRVEEISRNLKRDKKDEVRDSFKV